MNDEVAIKVDHISKKYCKSLKRSMLYGVTDIGRNTLGLSSHSEKLRRSEFWAVDDVSFEVKKGETLGLIGPNGSGKTTLLKMLNGIFWPDKGKITINGRVGALIEVGAGFHPMLTGRENVYINAAILGMTKKVDEKFDAIIEFADIGDFIDAPVKFYSSGMFVRLGFAVAVHYEPDILLVDEGLERIYKWERGENVEK
jgi:lipopolysaccharide transport system ATP-binding protein